MDFYGLKRKDLQRLCKKHGIAAYLKNCEMASRLASVFEENKIPPEDSVEAHAIKEKKVTFSPEDEVFEFTPSVKKCQRTRSQGLGIGLRRSKRNVAKGTPVAGSNESESNTGRDVSETKQACKVPKGCQVAKLLALDQFEDKVRLSGQMEITKQDETVRRRSTRLAANLVKSCVRPFSFANQSKQLSDTGDQETEKKSEVQETRKYLRKDDPQFIKIHRRSKRFVKDFDVETNIQDQRRSTRLKMQNHRFRGVA